MWGFFSLNPIGRNVMYDRNVNALWNLINSVTILDFKNHHFATDPGWGDILQRIHLGKTAKEYVEKINTISLGNECDQSPTLSSFDLWFSLNNMKRIPHQTYQYGNCLFESVANGVQAWNWKGKQVELRYRAVEWARMQTTKGTVWGKKMWKRFEERKGSSDNYGKRSYLEYLDFMANSAIYGTEYDIVMLCGFLEISIYVYTSSLLVRKNGELSCEPPMHFGGDCEFKIFLWHHKEHYEQIVIASN
jgi:hypothetical protein